MTFIAAWDRPSTWMLAGVLAANVALPVAHFWPAPQAPPAAQRPPAAAHPQAASATAAPAATETAPFAAVEPLHVAAPAMPHPPAPAPDVCLEWGPFRSSSAAESMARRLGLDGAGFRVRETETQAPSGYLVTVHAPGSREAARRVRQALAARHVDSYLLEHDGEGSLLAAGVFSAPERARSLQHRLQKLGYAADVKPLQRTRAEYRLLAEVTPGRDLAVPAAAACGRGP